MKNIFKKMFTIVLALTFFVPTTICAKEGYTVTYDLNGGTGTLYVDENVYEEGDYAFLSWGLDLAKGDLMFVYWSTNKDYVEGEEAYMILTEMHGDLYLYARYVEKEVTVTYDINGGSGIAPENGTYDISSAEFSENGYQLADGTGLTKGELVFAYWSTNKDYVEGETPLEFIVPSLTTLFDTTVYARYSSAQCTVTYDLNGGSGATIDEEIHDVRDIIQLPDGSSLSCGGVEFAYWSTNKDYVEGEEQYNDLYRVYSDMTFYARYLDTYTITYDLNGGGPETPVDETKYLAGEGCRLPSTSSYDKNGFYMAYWSTNKDYVEGEEQYEGYLTVESDLTLYARYYSDWEVTLYVEDEVFGYCSSYCYDGQDLYDVFNEFDFELAPAYKINKFYMDDQFQQELHQGDVTAAGYVQAYATLEVGKTSITINSAEHGYIEADLEEAYPDEEITITSHADDGYVLKYIIVKYLDSYWTDDYIRPESIDEDILAVYTSGYDIEITPVYVTPIMASDIKAKGQEGMILDAGEIIQLDLEEYTDFIVYSKEAATYLGNNKELTKDELTTLLGEDKVPGYAVAYYNSESEWYNLEDGTLLNIVDDGYYGTVSVTGEELEYGEVILSKKYQVNVQEDNTIVFTALDYIAPMVIGVNGKINKNLNVNFNTAKPEDVTIHISGFRLSDYQYPSYGLEEEPTMITDGITVTMDGEELTEHEEIEFEEGSVIVRINKEYLQTLKDGDHELVIEFDENYSNGATFTLNVNVGKLVPATGINTSWIKMTSILSLISIVFIIARKKEH